MQSIINNSKSNEFIDYLSDMTTISSTENYYVTPWWEWVDPYNDPYRPSSPTSPLIPQCPYKPIPYTPIEKITYIPVTYTWSTTTINKTTVNSCIIKDNGKNKFVINIPLPLFTKDDEKNIKISISNKGTLKIYATRTVNKVEEIKFIDDNIPKIHDIEYIIPVLVDYHNVKTYLKDGILVLIFDLISENDIKIEL